MANTVIRALGDVAIRTADVVSRTSAGAFPLGARVSERIRIVIKAEIGKCLVLEKLLAELENCKRLRAFLQDHQA